MDIAKQRNFLLQEIKINKPDKYSKRVVVSKNGSIDGVDGYKNMITDYGNLLGFLKPIIIQKYQDNEGLGQDLIEFIMNNLIIMDNRYNYGLMIDNYREWLEGYKDDLGLPISSSGSFWTAMIDEEPWYNDFIAEIFGLNEEEAEEYFEEFKNW